MTKDKINQFLNEFTNWASAQSDVQALALIGSYARGTTTETSDVDLVLISTNPKQYLQDSSWTQQFGVIEKQQVEDYGLLTSIRVWYTDDREVEYGITDERWAAIPLDEGSRQVISDGMRVLFEQDHILSRHQ
jgi:predicted nucleotidyltransferase